MKIIKGCNQENKKGQVNSKKQHYSVSSKDFPKNLKEWEVYSCCSSTLDCNFCTVCECFNKCYYMVVKGYVLFVLPLILCVVKNRLITLTENFVLHSRNMWLSCYLVITVNVSTTENNQPSQVAITRQHIAPFNIYDAMIQDVSYLRVSWTDRQVTWEQSILGLDFFPRYLNHEVHLIQLDLERVCWQHICSPNYSANSKILNLTA